MKPTLGPRYGSTVGTLQVISFSLHNFLYIRPFSYDIIAFCKGKASTPSFTNTDPKEKAS
ncbi:hypothetical protein HI914_03227 [Erysiphe necator]|nr:hypothetical protein HI914_03227 [Erysiphe necator]